MTRHTEQSWDGVTILAIIGALVLFFAVVVGAPLSIYWVYHHFALVWH